MGRDPHRPRRACRPSPASPCASRSRGRCSSRSRRPLGVRLGRGRHERALWLANGAAVLLPLLRGRLLVRAVHPLRPRRRALRDLPAVRGRARPLPPPGRAARAASRSPGMVLGFAGVAVIFSDDLDPPRRGDGAPRGPRHARLAAGVGGGQRRRQAVGERRPPALARGRAHADRRRRDGGGGPPRRAAPPARLRRPLGGGAPLPRGPRLGGHVHRSTTGCSPG